MIGHRLLVARLDIPAEALQRVLASEFDVLGVANDASAATSLWDAHFPDGVVLRSRDSCGAGTGVITLLVCRRPATLDVGIGCGNAEVAGPSASHRDRVILVDVGDNAIQALAAIACALDRHDESGIRPRKTTDPTFPPLALLHDLTPRELEVLRHLARGQTNEAIGASLGISSRGVHFHRTNIRRKLDIQSDAELVRIALLAASWSSPRLVSRTRGAAHGKS